MTNESHGQPNLRDMVREYYRDNDLPEASLRRLAIKARSRSWALPRWVVACAAAAVLAAAALGVGLIVRAPASPFGSTVTSSLAPSLVAVQIHADWCARSPEVAPIFAELLTEYGNKPVLFITLDITDDTRREQAKLLSSSLGIPEAFDKPFESGMIKLIDRKNHAVLATVTGRDQAGEFEARFAELLDKADDGGRVRGDGDV